MIANALVLLQVPIVKEIRKTWESVNDGYDGGQVSIDMDKTLLVRMMFYTCEKWQSIQS